MWGGDLKKIKNKFLDIISTIKDDKSSFEKGRRIKTRQVDFFLNKFLQTTKLKYGN